MGLLDFIKNRNQPSAEPTTQPKQETAKQMYTREAGEERAAAKPISLNEHHSAAATEANDLYRKGTQEGEHPAAASTPAPADSATDPQQPMVQPSMNQEKAAPPLTPTSAQAGAKEHEQEAHASVSPSPTPSPTLPRTTPSWER
jgi:hypothetical protein